MTTVPRIETVPISARIASTAAPSPPILSPRPTQRPAAIAAASVTRTNSRARLRSGAWRGTARAGGTPAGWLRSGGASVIVLVLSAGGYILAEPDSALQHR